MSRRLAVYPLMAVAALAAEGLVSVTSPGETGRAAVLALVCAAAVAGALVWSEGLALRPGSLGWRAGVLAPVASRRSSPNARLWLPAAIGPTALTLEIALLLFVASQVDSDGVAVTGLALALGIVMVVDAGPLALADTAGAIESERRLRPALSLYTLLVGLVACALLVPLWTGALGSPLGFAEDRWDATMGALLGLCAAPLFVAFRRWFYGYLASSDSIVWVATVARVLTSVLLATLLALGLGAGTTGIGLGLTVGVFVEVCVFAIRHRGADVVHLRPTPLSELREVARKHLPYSVWTLFSVAPAAAVLVALALSDGDGPTLLAWLVVFIGPWITGSVFLSASPMIAAGRLTSAKQLLALGLVLGALPTVLWLVLGIRAGIDPTAVAWLGLFPCLGAIRGLLRASLAAQDVKLPQAGTILAGSILPVLAFAIAVTAGLEPVAAAALAVLAGATAETPLLARSWLPLVR